MTMACVAVLPIPPGHHFVEVSVGLWMTNCSVDGSYVAVVDETGGGGAQAMGTPVAYAEPAYQQSDANPF